MSGKRLLDAVAVFNATRAVAYTHFSIRRSQFDLYARTSSLTRVINRIGRARNDFSRATRSSVQSATVATNAEPNKTLQTPAPEAVEGEGQSVKRNEGVKQDHHYDRAQENSVADSVPNQDLEVRQDSAKNDPLANGTILSTNRENGQTITDPPGLSPEDAMQLQRRSEAQIPSQPAEPPSAETFTAGGVPEFGVKQEQDMFYQPPHSTAPVLSALPRFKIPKTEGDVQGGDPHIPQKINADVFYSPIRGSNDDLASRTAQQDPSEEVMSGLFHSPRVARLLGTKSKDTRNGLWPKGSRMYVTGRPHLPQESADLSEARLRSSESGKGSDSDAESLKRLAGDISRDAQTDLAVSTLSHAP